MHDPSPDLCSHLIHRFQATAVGAPVWAWSFHPPIPLVGRRFAPNDGLLIYASAENLSWLTKRPPPPPRFTTVQAWDRYRVWYDQQGADNGEFFPDVGIQPITDGGLLAAGLFIARRLGLPKADDPRAFIESIAVTNWCKFSVRSPANADYISVLKKLTPSLPFVVGELAILRPAVALVPAQVWSSPILSAGMREASPRTRFLPVPQFNATVVNCHLGRYDEAARVLRQRLQGDMLAEWMAHLRRLPEAAAWRYIARLDELLRPVSDAL
jgi:hypothetical protein